MFRLLNQKDLKMSSSEIILVTKVNNEKNDNEYFYD